MDTRLHPRLRSGHGATGFGEPASNIEFQVVMVLMREQRNPRENIARGQANGDTVRVVDNGRILDTKAQRGGRRSCGRNGAPDF